MNPIIWVVLSVVLGSLAYSLWNWLWKTIKEPGTPFDKNYLFSMLISMLVSVIILPFVINNHTIPDNLVGFIVAGSFAFGFMLNALVNTPLTYYMNQVKTMRLKLKMMPLVPTAARRMIEIVGVIVLIGAILGAGTYAALSYSATVSITGNITTTGNLSVYADASGQTALTQVNWGNINPGSSVTVSIYIKNAANYPMVLSMALSGYLPTNFAQYSTTTWNYAQQVLQPGTILKVDITCAAATNAPAGSFSYNLVITGTQSG